jgi:hypothetical protein
VCTCFIVQHFAYRSSSYRRKGAARVHRTSVADLDPIPDPDLPDPHVVGLLDPDPDPFVRGMDPDPSINKQK